MMSEAIEVINQIGEKNTSSHISFDEMADYIFSDGRTEGFLGQALRINNHVMHCPACYRVYNSLLELSEKLEELEGTQTEREVLMNKIIRALMVIETGKTAEMVISECMRFKLWISFSIKNMQEIVDCRNMGFSYPKLLSVMKSSTQEPDTEGNESIIRSSLIDSQKNRVSVGLDGTLSLYFDSGHYPAGCRVLLLPDDEIESAKLIELSKYDDDISLVRFEGIEPGTYTVLIDNNQDR